MRHCLFIESKNCYVPITQESSSLYIGIYLDKDNDKRSNELIQNIEIKMKTRYF